MSDDPRITCTVNGVPVTATVPARLTLADFLRHELGLTGTHLGCEHGVCGACTVHVDGQPANSCLMLAAQADGVSITTVEGLSPDGEPNEVMQALSKHHGLQCGFCTPGMVMRITTLLDEHDAPTREEVSQALSGNLCRCTGYQGIVNAVLELSGSAEAVELPQAIQST
jgi:aerobic carbon-monoxide dehydrogenase small subunit